LLIFFDARNGVFYKFGLTHTHCLHNEDRKKTLEDISRRTQSLRSKLQIWFENQLVVIFLMMLH
jgi:hypothetical protein